MLYSKIFSKTKKSAKDFESLNATLLHRGGFIDQTMAGVYTYLPLGLRVLTKIENIIREEMNKVGSEVLMPSLSPMTLWETTKRLEKIDVLMKTTPANEKALEKNNSEYILNPTHEELITPIVQKFVFSYKNLPVAVYQIQTKFRNEARPKAGLMRGREFRMKDMYSFHASYEDFKSFYESMKDVYMTVYHRLGIGKDTFVTMASGGDFTTDYSHEFQTKCENGEDWVFYVPSKDVYYNKEVAPTNKGKLAEPGDIFPETGETYEYFKASEVGNIFPLSTKFSTDFDFTFTDADGTRKPIYMGSYGIGPSRLMGLMVEKFSDEKGIIWPEAVAPFKAHLIGLDNEKAQAIYVELVEAGIEVLFDDRTDVSAGEMFGDADLIGCPFRLTVGKKTQDKIEVKRRNSDKVELLDLYETTKLLKESSN